MKYNLLDMNTLDIYLSSLSNEEYTEIEPQILERKYKPMPLLSWDVFTENYHKTIANASKNTEINKVLALAKEYNWQNDLLSTFKNNDFEALIITDKNQKIIWVNNGFTEMTGYSKKYAINKTPRFLQGPETSISTKNRIRTKIKLDKPFTDIITNHRKDSSTYKCEVKIFPLYNDETTHFIAFEKQVV